MLQIIKIVIYLAHDHDVVVRKHPDLGFLDPAACQKVVRLEGLVGFKLLPCHEACFMNKVVYDIDELHIRIETRVAHHLIVS